MFYAASFTAQTKCEVYWPDTENEEKTFGDFAITLTDVERTADFVVRAFEVRYALNGVSTVRSVKQFHYTTWPDHGVPTRTSPIIAFRRKVRAHDESHPGLMLVHCRWVTPRVANPPGMGGRIPEFNSISRLPPDVAREMIISRNAPNLVLCNTV